MNSNLAQKASKLIDIGYFLPEDDVKEINERSKNKSLEEKEATIKDRYLTKKEKCKELRKERCEKKGEMKGNQSSVGEIKLFGKHLTINTAMTGLLNWSQRISSSIQIAKRRDVVDGLWRASVLKSGESLEADVSKIFVTPNNVNLP
ncbi:unnamed protein product [Protopolystoma xenopodis]|uniref:Uncharacterized protein n=1 Tax=Protopolystoma xenopodis TaxID=117903 RepID=A0A3S5AKI1_9PLAT|nr:unnamed protein product [Protopolystoma xenopodis]